MKKVIVNRKTWLRGKGYSNSYLLDKDNKMCCLGFACKQLLQHQNTLLRNYHGLSYEQELLIGRGITKAYIINDLSELSEYDREKCLIQVFKDNGIKLEFIN